MTPQGVGLAPVLRYHPQRGIIRRTQRREIPKQGPKGGQVTKACLLEAIAVDPAEEVVVQGHLIEGGDDWNALIVIKGVVVLRAQQLTRLLLSHVAFFRKSRVKEACRERRYRWPQ